MPATAKLESMTPTRMRSLNEMYSGRGTICLVHTGWLFLTPLPRMGRCHLASLQPLYMPMTVWPGRAFGTAELDVQFEPIVSLSNIYKEFDSWDVISIANVKRII